MATTDDKIKTLAKWYYDRLKLDKRTNGDEFYKFVGQGEHAKAEEEHCRKLAFATHNDGELLPDDFRYAFMNEALGAIMDASDLDEIELEADVYTSDLTSWLGSRNSRTGYCDEAVSEGLCDGSDMAQTLACGQYMEKREVLGAVLQHLREEAEAEEEAEEEANADA